jgi:pimeloyl-ACP methyl ester carboxylesterase
MRTALEARSSIVIRSARAPRGARAVWSVTGSGSSTLVVVPNWVTHLSSDWNAAHVGRFHRALAVEHRLLRYDRPGNGLADRDEYNFALDAEVELLRCVLDAAGERRVALFGAGFAGPVAVAFAAQHPDRVSRLILFNTGARMIAQRDSLPGIDGALCSALEQLVLADWGIAARTLCELLLPGCPPDLVQWFTDYQRGSATREAAAAMLAGLSTLDARPMLHAVDVPTFVVHRRDDGLIGVASGQELASEIRGATMRVVDGASMLPWLGDFGATVRACEQALSPPAARLTQREREVMQVVATGASNRHCARLLQITEHTVARHIANVFMKLDVSSRFAAVEVLRRAGILEPPAYGDSQRDSLSA